MDFFLVFCAKICLMSLQKLKANGLIGQQKKFHSNIVFAKYVDSLDYELNDGCERINK